MQRVAGAGNNIIPSPAISRHMMQVSRVKTEGEREIGRLVCEDALQQIEEAMEKNELCSKYC
jgi:hypothetical protein